MWLIDEPDFPLGHEIRLAALQGDCGLRNHMTPFGGVYLTEQPDRAREACLALVRQAQSEHSHLALIPELVIPKVALDDLISELASSLHQMVLIGGVEGLSQDEYRSLATRHGSPIDLPSTAAGTYVNAMVVMSRTASGVRVTFRAKRFASGPENAGGPQMVVGDGPFLVLRLGSAPFVVVPLLCSEFVWPALRARLESEVGGLQIDLVPVLQRNDDPERRYLGPAIHSAYQNNGQMRFVFVNQGRPAHTDGACYVVVPPTSPSPGFDLGRNELWLPDSCTYKGFRVPERLGCFWSAEVVHRSGPMNATRPPICSGRVVAVLQPDNIDLTGLPAGLMRDAAASHSLACDPVSPQTTKPRLAYSRSLGPSEPTFVLGGVSRASANESFFHLICDDRPPWANVESIVNDLVETAGLLACGGDHVQLGSFSGGNCSVSGRPVAVLFAPAVDAALVARFPTSVLLSGEELPGGIVLLQVEASSSSPRARTVGDVLRADRVSSQSEQLSDGPTRIADNAVTIRLGDIHFCEPKDLRPCLQEATEIAARNLAAAWLPGVFA